MRRLLLVLGCLSMIVAAQAAQAQYVAYNEDFASDPGFTIYGGYEPGAGEFLGWDAGDENCRVRLSETYDPTPKFIYSPSFSIMQCLCTHISFDIMVEESSFGFPLAAKFCPSDDIVSGPAIVAAFRGDHNRYLTISDGVANVYWPESGNVFPYGEWHNVDIDISSGVADIRITSLSSGEVYAEWSQVPFDPEPFDCFAMGSTTGNGDGTWAELQCDNILIEQECPVPVVEKSWGLVKHDFK